MKKNKPVPGIRPVCPRRSWVYLLCLLILVLSSLPVAAKPGATPEWLPATVQKRYPQSDITVKVVSMIDIPQGRQDSIGRWRHALSPLTETALYDYELKADLFMRRDLAFGSKE